MPVWRNYVASRPPARVTELTSQGLSAKLQQSLNQPNCYRTHIKRTLGKVTAVTESTKPITTDQIITLKTWLDQIEQKRAVLE